MLAQINERVSPMKNLLLIVVALFVITNPTTKAADLSVAVKHAEPFAYEEDGVWKGVSIDLLEQLSKEVGFTYNLFEQPSVSRMITVTEEGFVDMSVAAISLTPEREKSVDFSHAYFSTSQGILANTKASPVENAIWIGQKIAVILIGLIALMYIMGFIISRLDKGGEINGAHEGAWWALVTFSTTGYGDEVPVTNRGKIFASAWIIASLFLISIFTGYVASAMTVKHLSETTTQLADLYDRDVTVIDGTTAQLKLAELGIEYDSVDTLATAMNNFKSGKTDVIVYDKAMLDYASKDIEDVDVWAIDNSDEYYAIALPQDSELKEKINLGILKIISTSKWKATKAKYFGAE